jgi:hypothetical protein
MYYIQDIFNNFIKNDIAIDYNYMDRQPHLNFKMRTILIQWLLNIKTIPGLDVFGLAVIIIDKFLERNVISRQNLQLLGIMALRLAIKFHSRNYKLLIDECILLCDYAYAKNQCIQMEMDILNVLNYNLTTVHCHTFLNILLEYDDDSSSTILKDFASNILLLLLPKRMILKFLSSQVASAIIYISRKELLLTPYWTENLKSLTNYDVKTLRPCIDRIEKEKLDYNKIITETITKQHEKCYSPSSVADNIV